MPHEATRTIRAVTARAAVRTWHWWLLAFVAVLSFGPAIYVAGNRYGPDFETPPIGAIRLAFTTCDGPDLMLSSLFEKQTWALYRSMTVMLEDETGRNPPTATRWQYLGDRTLGERPVRPGLQVGGPLRIEGACGRRFTIHLWHHSALGWWVVYSNFGPFGPFGDAAPMVERQLLRLPAAPQTHGAGSGVADSSPAAWIRPEPDSAPQRPAPQVLGRPQ